MQACGADVLLEFESFFSSNQCGEYKGQGRFTKLLPQQISSQIMPPDVNSKPPLPLHHHDSYGQYKASDRKVLRWIHTAILTLHNEERSQTVGFESAQVPFNKLLKSVKEIANSDIDIPDKVVDLLTMSIKLRKEIGSFYSGHPNQKRRNDTHQHAIRVFTQILQIFREAKKDTRTAKVLFSFSIQVQDDDFSLAGHTLALADLLEEQPPALVGAEDDEWLRDNPGINRKGKPRTFPLEEYELVMDDESDSSAIPSKKMDKEFEALIAFLYDIHQMRQFCNKVWDTVTPTGDTSHITASFVTNQAVQLVKQKEYALHADFPKLQDLTRSFEAVFTYILTRVVDHLDSDCEELFLDRIMFYTWDNLRQFAEMRRENPDTNPVLRDGVFGYFDPTDDRQSMTSEERFMEDRCIMNLHWPDLMFANILSEDWPGKKGLGAEFDAFVNKGLQVTWALIFACQLQADTLQVRRLHLEYDLQVLRNMGHEMVKDYEEFLSSDFLYDDKMDLYARPHVQKCLETIPFVMVDKLKALKIRSGIQAGKQACQEDSLWLYNPWLTANAMTDLILNYFSASILVTAESGFLGSAIHLWNMLQQSGHIPSSQASPALKGHPPQKHVLLFDHLVELFGPSVFFGPPPKSAFHKQWDLMRGVKVEEFAQEKRKLKSTSQEPFRRRQYHEQGRGITMKTSDAWNLYVGDFFPDDKRSNKDGILRHPLALTFDMISSELGYKPPGSPASMEPRGPLINLNLLKVQSLCLRLFSRLEPILRPEIERISGMPLEHTQKDWPRLTGYIAYTERNRGQPNQLLLTKAAEVVRSVVGDEEVGSYLLL